MNKKFKGFDSFGLSDEITHAIIDQTLNKKNSVKHRLSSRRPFIIGVCIVVILITSIVVLNSLPEHNPTKSIVLVKEINEGYPTDFNLNPIAHETNGSFGFPQPSDVVYNEAFSNPSIYKMDLLNKEQVIERVDEILQHISDTQFKYCEVMSKEATSPCTYYEAMSDSNDFNSNTYGYTIDLDYNNISLTVNSFNEITLELKTDRVFDPSNNDQIMNIIKDLIHKDFNNLIDVDSMNLAISNASTSDAIIVESSGKYQSFVTARFTLSNGIEGEQTALKIELKTNLTQYNIEAVMPESQARAILLSDGFVKNTSIVNFVTRNFGGSIHIKEIIAVDTLVTNAGVLEYAVPMYRYLVTIENGVIDGENYVVELYVPAVEIPNQSS